MIIVLPPKPQRILSVDAKPIAEMVLDHVHVSYDDHAIDRVVELVDSFMMNNPVWPRGVSCGYRAFLSLWAYHHLAQQDRNTHRLVIHWSDTKDFMLTEIGTAFTVDFAWNISNPNGLIIRTGMGGMLEELRNLK